MIHLIRQNEIMTELAQILHDEANSGYDQVICEYSYLLEYKTFDNYFVITRDEKEANLALSALATVKNSRVRTH